METDLTKLSKEELISHIHILEHNIGVDTKRIEELEKENAVAKPVLKQNARLFEENRKLKEKIIKIQEQNKDIVNKKYIPKSVIRDKIEELEKKIEIAQGEELLIFDSKLDILKEILGDE